MKDRVLSWFFAIYRSIFARPSFRSFNSVVFHASLRALGVLNSGSDKISGERYLIRKLLPKLLKNQRTPVFFDVGANVGGYTLSLLESFPTAQVYAFEPHPKNFEKLRERTVGRSVEIHQLGLGETQGCFTLYDRADEEGSTHASLHKEVISELHKQGVVSVEVQVETIDAIMDRYQIDYVDFLKIDTEGHELPVLLGAEKALSEGKIGCIHFEFNEMNVVSRVFLRDFRRVLVDYDLYRLLPSGLLTLGQAPIGTELFAYQNYIAVPKGTKVI